MASATGFELPDIETTSKALRSSHAELKDLASTLKDRLQGLSLHLKSFQKENAAFRSQAFSDQSDLVLQSGDGFLSTNGLDIPKTTSASLSVLDGSRSAGLEDKTIVIFGCNNIVLALAELFGRSGIGNLILCTSSEAFSRTGALEQFLTQAYPNTKVGCAELQNIELVIGPEKASSTLLVVCSDIDVTDLMTEFPVIQVHVGGDGSSGGFYFSRPNGLATDSGPCWDSTALVSPAVTSLLAGTVAQNAIRFLNRSDTRAVVSKCFDYDGVNEAFQTQLFDTQALQTWDTQQQVSFSADAPVEEKDHEREVEPVVEMSATVMVPDVNSDPFETSQEAAPSVVEHEISYLQTAQPPTPVADYGVEAVNAGQAIEEAEPNEEHQEGSFDAPPELDYPVSNREEVNVVYPMGAGNEESLNIAPTYQVQEEEDGIFNQSPDEIQQHATLQELAAESNNWDSQFGEPAPVSAAGQDVAGFDEDDDDNDLDFSADEDDFETGGFTQQAGSTPGTEQANAVLGTPPIPPQETSEHVGDSMAENEQQMPYQEQAQYEEQQQQPYSMEGHNYPDAPPETAYYGEEQQPYEGYQQAFPEQQQAPEQGFGEGLYEQGDPQQFGEQQQAPGQGFGEGLYEQGDPQQFGEQQQAPGQGYNEGLYEQGDPQQFAGQQPENEGQVNQEGHSGQAYQDYTNTGSNSFNIDL